MELAVRNTASRGVLILIQSATRRSLALKRRSGSRLYRVTHSIVVGTMAPNDTSRQAATRSTADFSQKNDRSQPA